MANDLTHYTSHMPVVFDPSSASIVDLCSSGSHSEAGQLMVVNLPTPAERDILVRRSRELIKALQLHDRDAIARAVTEMLKGYSTIVRDDKLTAKQRVATYVQEMGRIGDEHAIPTWAVERACQAIRTGSATSHGISLGYVPSTASVRLLAKSYAEPVWSELRRIQNVLHAKLWAITDRSPATEEQRAKIEGGFQKLRDTLAAKAAEDDERDRQRKTVSERERRSAEARILQEYAAMDHKPVMAGDVVISPTLARQLGVLNRPKSALDRPSDFDM